MTSTALQFALLGLLQVASSATVPTRTWASRPQVANAPAMPTNDLVSDFKKNNVSAQWAEGHPKEWGSEDVVYEWPFGPSEYRFAGSVTEDEKFLALANSSHAKIFRMDTGALVSLFKLQHKGGSERIIFLAAPGGGYDMVVSASNYTSDEDTTVKVHLSEDGTPDVDKQVAYPGRIGSFDDLPFSKNRRRFLTASRDTGSRGHVNDLDKPSNLTLSGHTDWIMSQAFSPDDKYISTSSWDGYAKIWNATTGELLHTFGPLGGQNWVTQFSPDGKYVLVSNGGQDHLIRFWSMSNLTAGPTITLGPFNDWVRYMEFSPDSEYLATGNAGEVLVYRMSDMKVVQSWQMEDQSRWVATDITWLEGRKKLAYRITGGLELYDFEKNLKYRWGPGDFDHFEGSPEGSTHLLKNKGLIGGLESDGKMRFWKFQG